MVGKSDMKRVLFFVFSSFICLSLAADAGASDYYILNQSQHETTVDIPLDGVQLAIHVESFLVALPPSNREYFYWAWIWREPRSGLSCWGFKKVTSASLESWSFQPKGFAEKLRDIRLSAVGIPCLTWEGYTRSLWIGGAADHYKTFEDAHQALINRLTALLKNPDSFKEQSRWIGLDDYLPEDFFYDGAPEGRKFIARLKEVKRPGANWVFSLEGYGRALAELVVDKDYHVVESCYPPVNAR